MAQEAFCPEHGPYDASLGICPYPHAGSVRPGVPLPLEDDLPTDFGMGGGTAPTMIRGRGGDEGETEIPAARRSGHRVLDINDEDETEMPRSSRQDDFTELEAPVRSVLGMLWVKEGPRHGRFYPIKHGSLVGRKKGDLILDDPKVSSEHAKFTMENEDFYIWDFGSANGTYVNGKKIREATRLEENDLIKIGETVFVIKLLEPKPKRKTSGARSSANSKKSSK